MFRGQLRLASLVAMRATRHSSPDLSCRVARIFVGVFWDFCHKCKRRTRRKNEGAVADQRFLTGCLFFIASTMFEAAHFRFKRVLWRSFAHIRTASALPSVASRNRGARPPYRYVLGAKNGW